MSEKQKMFVWFICILAIASALTKYFSTYTFTQDRYCNIVIIVAAFCISLSALLIIKPCVYENVCWFIRLLSISFCERGIVTLCFCYMKVENHGALYEDISLWMQSQFITMVSIIFGMHFCRYQKDKFNNGFLLVLVETWVCLICLVLRKDVMIICTNVLGFFLLLSLLYIGFNKERMEAKYIGYSSPYLGFLFMTLAAEYVIHLVLRMSTDFIVQYLLECIESVLLLLYTYQVNLKKPWEEKMAAMEKVEKKLQKQHKSCEEMVSLSHELKTPVNVIKSAMTILSLDFSEGILQDKINESKTYCQHIMNMIQDMIDIQKIKSQCIGTSTGYYNVVELIDNVIEAFANEGCRERIIFDPQEEEIYDQVDQEIFQQGCMLMLGMLLNRKSTGKVFIDVDDQTEEDQIEINIYSDEIKKIKERINDIEQMEKGNEDNIEERLTVQLIILIVKLHHGCIYFDDENETNRIKVEFTKQGGNETLWIDENNVQVIQERIRCRYNAM